MAPDDEPRTIESLADDLELQIADRGIEPVVRDTLALIRRAEPEEARRVAAALDMACGVSFGTDTNAWTEWLAKLRDTGVSHFAPLADDGTVYPEFDRKRLSSVIKNTTSVSITSDLSAADGPAPLEARPIQGAPALDGARAFGPGRESLLPGCTLVGSLGAGGMADVFLIEDAAGERYALRTILGEVAAEKDYVRRFERETRIALSLSHPNIIRTHEAGTLRDGRPYVVGEFCAGGSLASYLETHGPIGERTGLRWLSQAAEALSYAWREHRLVHRDLTPGNLLLDDNGDLRIADFGLAKRLTADATAITGEGVALGSPYYISPEQATRPLDIDNRADLYSLGATFFHVLCGRPPFDDAVPSRVVIKHVEAEPPKLRSVRPDLSEDLESIFARLLAKDAAARPQDAEELVQLIREHVPAGVAEEEEARAREGRLRSVRPVLRTEGEAGLWESRTALLTIGPSSGEGGAQVALFTRLPVRFGRTRESGVSLPLRLYPISEHKDETYEISRLHGQFDYVAGQWRLTDFDSRNGTEAGGVHLTPHVPHILVEQTNVTVGGVLELGCAPVGDDLGPEAWLDGKLTRLAATPALMIARHGNRTGLAYAIVRDRLPLDAGLLLGRDPERIGTLWWLDHCFLWQSTTPEGAPLVPVHERRTWNASGYVLKLERLERDVFR